MVWQTRSGGVFIALILAAALGNGASTSLPRRLLQSNDVQRTAGDVQTLEDQGNADVADTLIDDALDVGSGRSNGADGSGKPDGGAAPSGTNAGATNPPPGSLGRRLSQLQPNDVQDVIGDAQTVEDNANADLADVAIDDALDVLSGRTNGEDGPLPARPDDAPPADYNGVGKKLLQLLGQVQQTAGDVQTLEDQGNADVADTLIDDVFDVGSGRSNGADGSGKPDGGAAPSGTNAGATNPPPGSLGRRLSQLQPNDIQDVIGDAQTVEDNANADAADVAIDDALDVLSGRTNGEDGPLPARPDDAPAADYNGVGKKLLQLLGEVQQTAGDVQTLEDQGNADVADTLIDDVFDVGSGRSNGADGSGKPDGGAAPSGTNAGATNPPPGSLGKRLL